MPYLCYTVHFVCDSPYTYRQYVDALQSYNNQSGLVDREGSSYYYLPLTPCMLYSTTAISGPILYVDDYTVSFVFLAGQHPLKFSLINQLNATMIEFRLNAHAL